MESEGVTRFLSAYNRVLILAGSLICFFSLFLPFWEIVGNNSAGFVSISGLAMALSDSWYFWPFLLVIIAIYGSYLKGYGEEYPYLFLGAGILLFLLTLWATREYGGTFAVISLSTGFYSECIGSLAVGTGGYFYYLKRK
jgi:hypothetical protein